MGACGDVQDTRGPCKLLESLGHSRKWVMCHAQQENVIDKDKSSIAFETIDDEAYISNYAGKREESSGQYSQRGVRSNE